MFENRSTFHLLCGIRTRFGSDNESDLGRFTENGGRPSVVAVVRSDNLSFMYSKTIPTSYTVETSRLSIGAMQGTRSRLISTGDASFMIVSDLW